MARTVSLTANQKRSIVAKYKKGAGSAALGEEFSVSPGVVLRIVREAGEEVRGRGRPKKVEVA